MKLNALPTSQRFGLLVGLCAVAILVPASMQTRSAWKSLGATAQELEGLAPVMAVQEVIRPREHRVRLRRAAPAEGRLLRAGRHRRRAVAAGVGGGCGGGGQGLAGLARRVVQPGS